MDFGNAPRTTPVGGPPPVARADVVATQGSVAVELAPEKTVQSAQAGDAVRVDIRAQDRDARARDAQNRASFERRTTENQQQQRQADQDLDEVVERRLVIEPRTRAIVLQKKDSQTGETISQLPDETLLKLRIYSRELTERAREADEARQHYVERTA
ncbi:hypothetical protein [Bosea sp. 124]|uniref:hypothetical protein n=1 Tax=Bosea sp. 124 TaxID=2135642 RepID=UPI000D3797BA|nr:hypothetical protein [Bosea sp. 124]PTM42339.1 hypothetical protein C8D03_3926 [Bosea sp. 124]